MLQLTESHHISQERRQESDDQRICEIVCNLKMERQALECSLCDAQLLLENKQIKFEAVFTWVCLLISVRLSTSLNTCLRIQSADLAEGDRVNRP